MPNRHADTGGARIRTCTTDELPRIHFIINDAALAYRGVIPDDQWHEPYMTEPELESEVAAGVRFLGWYSPPGTLLGVMGAQDVQDVTLIRHAYVLSARRRGGIGSGLITALMKATRRPVLVGTWKAASWAIAFYERHGFRPAADVEALLRRYWTISERQIESSVVLASSHSVGFSSSLQAHVSLDKTPSRRSGRAVVASKPPARDRLDRELMPETTEASARADSRPIDVRTAPDRYRHWRLRTEGRIATLELDVDESGGLAPGYELKLNSYDLGVDIELADAVQRLRFEHPEVAAVVIRSARDRVFCAGANIRMLGGSSHAHKVAFCKFTNETRCAIEDAGAHSGQRYLCAINGTAAGGGYELALATDWILLVDDGASAVSLPEVALLGVLPGTGGLVRVVDKRKVRRDRADVFSTTEEGIRGARALEWGLVDEIAPSSRFEDAVAARARALAALTDRPSVARGIRLREIERRIESERIAYASVEAEIDREREIRACRIRVRGPAGAPPAGIEELVEAGDAFWPLALARELEDLVLHLRHNEPEIGTLVFTSEGALDAVAAHDAFLLAHREHWLAREILLYWKRLLKRIDLTSRSIVALVEPGSCFAGLLLELVLAADRAYMLDGPFGDDGDDSDGDGRDRDGNGGSGGAPAAVRLTESNFGCFPGVNGLARLASRCLDDGRALARARQRIGRDLTAAEAEAYRLVTFTPDEIDWEDEVRLALEARASFSPDALTGMEASLRCPGPETMESRIFGRLTAWQNWIFQRENAVGERGALTLYGSGARADFDRRRV